MNSDATSPRGSKPRILILYYSFTQQTQNVAEAMGEVFRELDCEVDLCNIEFVDEHYQIELPFRASQTDFSPL